jgi:CDP-glucose 4,6-dehydratase
MKSGLAAEVHNKVNNEILHQYLSAEKARTRLHWKPLFDLDQGLERTIEWYKDFFGVR